MDTTFLIIGILMLIIGLLLLIAPAFIERINVFGNKKIFPHEAIVDRRIIVGILFIAVAILLIYMSLME